MEILKARQHSSTEIERSSLAQRRPQGEGKVSNTIHLHNQSHWEIHNLTVSNTDGGDWTDKGRVIRRAIYITAEDAGDIEHIAINEVNFECPNFPTLSFLLVDHSLTKSSHILDFKQL